MAAPLSRGAMGRRKAMGALTPRCGRYHGESGGANPGGIGEHFLPRDPFERRPHPRRRRRRSCGRSACSALSARRDGDGLARAESRAALRRALMGGRGGRRETAHNVTAAADYRTACCPIARTGLFVMLRCIWRSPRMPVVPGTRTRPRDLQVDGAEAPKVTSGTPTNLTHLASRRVALAHKNKQQQNIPRRGRALTKCFSQATEKTKRILLSLWLLLWIQ
jgi:hypothetical protein